MHLFHKYLDFHTSILSQNVRSVSGCLDRFELRRASDRRKLLPDSFDSATEVRCNGDQSINDLFYCHCLTDLTAASTFVAVRVKSPSSQPTRAIASPVSNIVRIFAPNEVTPPVKPDDDGSDVRPGGRNYERELVVAYGALGALAGILLLATIVLAALLIRTRKRTNGANSGNGFRSGLAGHSLDLYASVESMNAPRRPRVAENHEKITSNGKPPSLSNETASELSRISVALGKSSGTLTTRNENSSNVARFTKKEQRNGGADETGSGSGMKDQISTSTDRPRPVPRGGRGGVSRVEITNDDGRNTELTERSQSLASLAPASVKSSRDSLFPTTSTGNQRWPTETNAPPAGHTSGRVLKRLLVHGISPDSSHPSADDTFAKQAAADFYAEVKNVHATPVVSGDNTNHGFNDDEVGATDDSFSTTDTEEDGGVEANEQRVNSTRSIVFADPKYHRTIISIV